MSSFQQQFAQALLAGTELATQPGFAVYRNTVAQGCIDALEANFPTVLRLVGGEWFRSAAGGFARSHPPQDGRLLLYGDDAFPAFLQALPTTADLPWLAGIARLDALWRASHAAADAPVLDAGELAGLSPEALGAQVLQPHPAARWLWFDELPVAGIWSRNRDGSDADFAWQGDGVLLTRPEGDVRWRPLSHAGCAFLDACAHGSTLGDAAQHCLDLDARINLAALLQQLLQAGAFTRS
ncbi:DUF2063 domain-containing protein [Ramlibacter sp. G-1-2-2]|uniref:DUF2063 domain-containing protein n=1 Tax=Ramlibacter agri TaxID=2728837 RepID=A0A848GY56_9BURK|nr:DNA-binding domain-containing protein [Ramlibacter agri]NML43616.1 DUF2063 domain-containing protein [Ramlibacter agri]